MGCRMPADRFPKPALHPIADHCIPYLPAHRKTEACVGKGIGQMQRHEVRRTNSPPASLDTTVVRRATQATLREESLIASIRRPIGPPVRHTANATQRSGNPPHAVPPCETSSRGTQRRLVALGRRGRREPLAALESTTGQHGTAIGGRHPAAEAVGATTLDARRLVGTLHCESSGGSAPELRGGARPRPLGHPVNWRCRTPAGYRASNRWASEPADPADGRAPFPRRSSETPVDP